jgi:hypothetical protein
LRKFESQPRIGRKKRSCARHSFRRCRNCAPCCRADAVFAHSATAQDGPASVGEIVETLVIKQANASKRSAAGAAEGGYSAISSFRMPIVFDLCEQVFNGLRAEGQAKLELLS